MSRNRKKIFMGLLVWGGISLAAFGIVRFHGEGLGRILEWSVNRSAKEFFRDSFQIGSSRLDRNLGIRLTEVEARLHLEDGDLPLRIESIVSQGPVAGYFSKEGLVLQFEGIRLAGSAGESALRGFSGEIKGEFTLRVNPWETAGLHLRLRVEEPGGLLESRFLAPLLRYLPEQSVRREVRRVIGSGEQIGFQSASLRLDETGPDSMKIFLHMLIPDYNLHLNLKIEVRVDEKDILAQLVRLAGLVPAH